MDGTWKHGTMGRLSPDSVKQAEATPDTLLLDGDRCDAACPAQAQVHLIHDPDGELAFCGHHFHQHALALMSSGWQPAD